LTAEARAKREEVRVQAAGLFEQGVPTPRGGPAAAGDPEVGLRLASGVAGRRRTAGWKTSGGPWPGWPT
jgi:hypothetical protein